MTDHDAFEFRLRAAVHGYAGRVSSDLDPVEFAHRIATTRPRRRWFAVAIAWRPVALARLAWVLLLLMGLLIALLGGMLDRWLAAGASAQGGGAADGEVFECPAGSTPDAPGPVDQARPPQDILPAMAFDRKAGRLLALVGVDDGAETWTFDVCTNTWAQMHPDREPPEGSYSGRLVYDVDSDVTITVLSGSVFVYDLSADSWTKKDGMAPPDAQLWAYDPAHGPRLRGRSQRSARTLGVRRRDRHVDPDRPGERTDARGGVRV